MDSEESAQTGWSIIDTINSVNGNIASVDRAIAEIGTRESWLRESVDGILSDSSAGTKAKILAGCAGALQIAYKKGYLDDLLPFYVSPSSLANIAVSAVENIKTIAYIAAGYLSVEEELDRVQKTAVARAVDFIAANGEAAGAFIGSFFVPQGLAVGKAVGKALSYCAKTEAKQAMIDAGNALCSCARSCVKTLVNAAANALSSIKTGLQSIFA